MTKPTYSKEEIKENRKEALKDPYAFFIKPTIEYWKKRPIHAIGTVIFWFAIYFLAFSTLQALNHDMIYCDSTFNEYDGKLMRVYNPFIEFVNQELIRINQENINKPIGQQFNLKLSTLNLSEQPEDELGKYKIHCNYNITKWRKEDTDILYNLDQIIIKRWNKNTQ